LSWWWRSSTTYLCLWSYVMVTSPKFEWGNDKHAQHIN
jgi:hypothetical protein